MRISCLLLQSVLLGTSEAIVAKPTQLNTQKFLKEPSPVSRSLKYEGAFHVTGEYSIEFMQCVSLKMEGDSDMFAKGMIDHTKSDQVLKQKSYVLFNVCETSNCKRKFEHGRRMHMTSLENYMKSLIPAYKGVNIDSLCEVCDEYCL